MHGIGNIKNRPGDKNHLKMPTEPLRINDRFPDVSALGRAFGFELGFHQLDGGDPTIPASALVSENITLTHMRFARRYHQTGLPPAGRLSFGVPVIGLRDWFGRRYRTSSILPFNHPGGIDGVSEENFEAFTISFTGDYLDEIAKIFQMSVPSLFDGPAPESIIDRGESADRFRELLIHVFADRGPRLDAETEEELIVTLLNAGQNGTAVTDQGTPENRNRAIRAALAYIAEHPDKVVTVRDICAACNIALRTLNRAFNERFGVGPKAYLKRQRLCAVRAALLQSLPDARVADIANRWGFWHLGQFASDYRRLFGELPSQTLRK